MKNRSEDANKSAWDKALSNLGLDPNHLYSKKELRACYVKLKRYYDQPNTPDQKKNLEDIKNSYEQLRNLLWEGFQQEAFVPYSGRRNRIQGVVTQIKEDLKSQYYYHHNIDTPSEQAKRTKHWKQLKSLDPDPPSTLTRSREFSSIEDLDSVEAVRTASRLPNLSIEKKELSRYIEDMAVDSNNPSSFDKFRFLVDGKKIDKDTYNSLASVPTMPQRAKDYLALFCEHTPQKERQQVLHQKKKSLEGLSRRYMVNDFHRLFTDSALLDLVSPDQEYTMAQLGLTLYEEQAKDRLKRYEENQKDRFGLKPLERQAREIGAFIEDFVNNMFERISKKCLGEASSTDALKPNNIAERLNDFGFKQHAKQSKQEATQHGR